MQRLIACLCSQGLCQEEQAVEASFLHRLEAVGSRRSLSRSAQTPQVQHGFGQQASTAQGIHQGQVIRWFLRSNGKVLFIALSKLLSWLHANTGMAFLRQPLDYLFAKPKAIQEDQVGRAKFPHVV